MARLSTLGPASYPYPAKGESILISTASYQEKTRQRLFGLAQRPVPHLRGSSIVMIDLFLLTRFD